MDLEPEVFRTHDSFIEGGLWGLRLFQGITLSPPEVKFWPPFSLTDLSENSAGFLLREVLTCYLLFGGGFDLILKIWFYPLSFHQAWQFYNLHQIFLNFLQGGFTNQLGPSSRSKSLKTKTNFVFVASQHHLAPESLLTHSTLT